MKLNLSKGDMYGFITHTWNPIKGRCYHDCAYCYMKSKIQNPPPVYLDESELNGIFQQNQFIFIGSGTDDFALDVPSEWISKVLDFCIEATSHQVDGQKTRFLIQTKNPERILEFIDHPLFKTQQIVVCTTIETNRHYPEIMNNAPLPQQRAEAMAKIAEHGIMTYVTIEPIMDFDLAEMIALIKMCKPEQVNIGAESKHRVKIPQPVTVNQIIRLVLQLLCFTKVKVKKNLNSTAFTQLFVKHIKQNYTYDK